MLQLSGGVTAGGTKEHKALVELLALQTALDFP
jgi:hypothetical protein